jgi:hypothetical protein
LETFKSVLKKLLLFLPLLLFSSEIEIDAKIFPAILKYDLKLKEKLVNGKVKISILYPSSSKREAIKLRNLISKKYKFQIELIPQNQISKLKTSSALYLFDLETRYLKKALRFAKERHLITFSKSPALLRFGVVASILNKRRVRPILNKRAIVESGISLSSTLLKVSFIYEN